MQLWDRQLSFAGHAQLMFVMTEHLNCLQVPIVLQLLTACRLFAWKFGLRARSWAMYFLTAKLVLLETLHYGRHNFKMSQLCHP